MSKTACAVPFSVLDISPDGAPLICCQAPIMLTVGGRPAAIDRDPLEAIWNAPELIEIRGALARGEQPEACRTCWDHEKAGPASLRKLMNSTLHAALGADWSLEALMRESARNGYRMSARPRWYQLQLGNTCNLKCRSCSPTASSRIAGDSVHRVWSATDFYQGHLPTAIPRGEVWYRDPAKIAEVFGPGDEDIFLSLLGGEPFLIDEVWELAQVLVDRGWSKRISLGLVTNGTRRRPELERLAPEFRSVFVSVSIDGYGKLFEYLRHGAKWGEMLANLEWLQSIPEMYLVVTPTMQNTNVLGAARLFRFLDERGITAHFNVLTFPKRLAATNLPPRVRRIAADRLRRYLDEGCRPENRTVVSGWAGLLESTDETFDPTLFREFMEFTNDLDVSRGQSLAEAEPELFALLGASGVPWTNERRHTQSAPVSKPRRRNYVNRTVSRHDVIYAAYAKGVAENYFDSALAQADELDALLSAHGHEGLAACRAAADFASHYGRMTRALHARMPHAVVYACDIDRDAVDFCARELGSVPVVTGWRPNEETLPRGLDLVVCMSLLTHTPRDHWRRALRAWFDMLEPGGFVAFTFLSEAYIDRWLAMDLEAYGPYPHEARVVTAGELEEQGFAFLALQEATYGGESFYGVAFATADVVRAEVVTAGFELLEIRSESTAFHQALVFARKPGEREETTPARELNRDVRVVALYDPRGYEQAGAEGMWSQLVASQPVHPLPTDLGFCDPRVPEVREAQAQLAREHGIDAFCYLYPWSHTGSRWDAPLRGLLATGRPEFPFCLMWANEEGDRVSVDDADQLLLGLMPYLQDRRYLRNEERPLFVVRDVGTLTDPRATAGRWRALAAEHGVGEICLCAAEPIPADSLDDLGFDAALELPSVTSGTSYVELVAASLARPRPRQPFLRGVLCQREPYDAQNIERYELWLRSAIEQSGRAPVFVRAWNDWIDGAYLEPDDRDGYAFLSATRRAVRGPSSGLVLLRRLRDSLGAVDGEAAQYLAELAQVVSLHERSRDELTALVESAYVSPSANESGQRWVSVSTSHLGPAPGRVSIDRFGTAMGAELRVPDRALFLKAETIDVVGWAHVVDVDPSQVDLFLALTSISGRDERVFRMHERNVRPDVVSAYPDYPPRCGFAGSIPLGELPADTYRVGIVQRTPSATYYDATTLSVRRG